MARLPHAKSLLSRFGRAFLGPVGLALRTGYFKSCLRGYAVDAAGRPIPMYTYPCVRWLIANEEHFRECKVLEFGSGQSTRWWAARCKSVTAVEYNERFAAFLRTELAGAANVSIVVGDDYRNITGVFDIVSIDGFPRVEAAGFAMDKVAPGGIIIVDNSDVQSIQSICTLLNDNGFFRVDFIGLSPAAYHDQCTSVFAKSSTMFMISPTVRPVSPRSSLEKLQ